MKKIILLLAFFLTLFGERANAAELIVPANELTPGAKLTSNSMDKIVVYIDPGTCYCCSVIPQPSSVFIGVSDFEIGDGVTYSTLQITERSAASPRVGVGARFCFSTPDTTSTVAVRFAPNITGEMLVRCEETALYGGFNITATPFNFLEIVNTIKVSSYETGNINPVMTVKDTVTDKTILNKTSINTVAAGKRVDVNVHDAVRAVVGDAQAAPTVFGPLTLCHDGPPGGLSVTLSQYDASFNMVNQQVFKTRAQLMGGR